MKTYKLKGIWEGKTVEDIWEGKTVEEWSNKKVEFTEL